MKFETFLMAVSGWCLALFGGMYLGLLWVGADIRDDGVPERFLLIMSCMFLLALARKLSTRARTTQGDE